MRVPRDVPGIPDLDNASSPTESSFETALDRVGDALGTFVSRPPGPTSNGLVYELMGAFTDWTAAFWSGLCWLAWLAYEVTGEDRYRSAAETHLEEFAAVLEADSVVNLNIGFIYTLSAVAAARCIETQRARRFAIRAASALADLY